MIRKILLLVVYFVGGVFAHAQIIDSIFVSAPNSVLPMLEFNSRLDLLDLYNYQMEAKVYNDLGGETCLVEKDSLHFKVETTSSSTLDLQVLYWGTDTLYSCIRTVKMPEEHSQIVYMDNQWHPISVKKPKDVTFDALWIGSDSLSEDRVEYLRMALSPYSVLMKWEETKSKTPVLVYELSLEGLLKKDRADAKLCLKSLRYRWIGGKFEKI